MVAESLRLTTYDGSGNLPWNIFVEKTANWGTPDFVTEGFLDHINATKDSTDYLWCITR